MDEYTFRRDKFRVLLNEKYGGFQSAFCNATGINPSYVSRMLLPDGHPNRKRIGGDMLDRIRELHPRWVIGADESDLVPKILAILDDLTALPESDLDDVARNVAFILNLRKSVSVNK